MAPRRRKAAAAAPLASSLLGVAASAVALLRLDPTRIAAFAGGWRVQAGSQLPRQVGSGGHDGSSVVLVRPRAIGFKPDDEPKSRELAPVVPGFSKQQFLFYDLVQKGYPASEVFMRFEGKTPWKLVGEVVSSTGNFEEAVRAQWTLLAERSYYLSRKARFWLPTEHPIRFGYADWNATIVTVEAGPLPEATSPLTLKEMLLRSGYKAADKPWWWRHMHTNIKNLDESKNDQHRRKPHLMHRQWNNRVEAHKWYNPDRYRGRYTAVMRKKRGLVVGQGPSR